MSYLQRPLLIAPRASLQFLQLCGRVPADFFFDLSQYELEDLIALTSENISLEDSEPRYLTLESEMIKGEVNPGCIMDKPVEVPMLHRLLSKLSGRSITSLELVKPGSIAQAIAHQNELEVSIQRIGQEDITVETNWTLLLVVKGELTPSDMKALHDLKEEIMPSCPKTKPRSLKVYILDGKLRTDHEGRFVEAKYIWENAVTPLLSKFLAEHHSPEHRGIFSWRTIVIEPDIALAPVLDMYHTWLEQKVFNSDERFTPAPIELRPIGVAFEEDTPKRIVFQDSYLEKNQFVKRVEHELAPISLSQIRNLAASTREKIIRKSNDVDAEVRQGEVASWQQAHQTPEIMGTMSKQLSKQLSSQHQLLLEDVDPWEALQKELEAAEQSRKKAILDAEQLDNARSRFVGWGTRLILLFVTTLLIFYLVFVTLYPVLQDGGIDVLMYWGACGIGLSGAVLALFISWNFELSCGKHAAKRVTETRNRTLRNNSTKACLKYIAASNERNLRKTLADTLDYTIFLSKRLRTIVAFVTRAQRDTLEIQPYAFGKLRSIDSEIYQNGTRISIGAHSDEMTRVMAETVLRQHGQSLQNDLRYEWNMMSNSCDLDERGTFPFETVSRMWGQAISKSWALFYRLVVDYAVAEWREDQTLTLSSVCEKILELQGASSSTRPFMSSRNVSNEERKYSSQALYMRDNLLCHKLEEALNRETFPNLTSHVVGDLSYFGLFFEEMPFYFGEGGQIIDEQEEKKA
jgi:hypothetical protein